MSCSNCQKFVSNIKTGKLEEWPKGSGKPIPRPPRLPTPCWDCPKESPDKAKEYELSEKNRQAYEFYLKVQHTQGAYMASLIETDPIVARNHAIIGEIREAKTVVELGRMLRPIGDASSLGATGGRTR